jgi:hypothetical protein
VYASCSQRTRKDRAPYRRHSSALPLDCHLTCLLPVTEDQEHGSTVRGAADWNGYLFFLAMDMEESNLLPEHLALLNLRRVCLVKALLDSSQPLSPCNCISSASHGGYPDFWITFVLVGLARFRNGSCLTRIWDRTFEVRRMFFSNQQVVCGA